MAVITPSAPADNGKKKFMIDPEPAEKILTASSEYTAELTAVEKTLEELVSLCRSNPSEAENLAIETLARAEKLGNPSLIGSSLCLLSRAVSLLRDSTEAIEFASRAVEILRPIDEKDKLATALNNLGNCYRRMAESLKAVKCFEEALEIHNSIGNRAGIALVHNNLGLALMRIGAYERAYSSFMNTVRISDEIDRRFLKSVALSNVADVLIDQGEYNTAEQYLETSLQICRELDRRVAEAYCLWELGRLKQKQGQLGAAERFLRESLSLRKELGSSKVGESLFELAKLLEDESRQSEAEKILLEAIDLFQESDNSSDLRLARASLAILRIHMNILDDVEKPLIEPLASISNLKSDQDRQRETQILKALSEYHEKTGNLPEALQYSKRYAEERDCLFEQRQQKNVTRLKLRADFQASEEARELLEEKTRELEESYLQLQRATDQIKSLHGLLPICAYCKNIRNDDGYWEQIEEYISTNSDTTFSHSLCPKCTKELYPNLSNETKPESVQSNGEGSAD